ncbi:MAG: type I 3-dehydroquinate dehydratase, partial [Verrucomicrobiaceae bacterium]
MSQRKFQLFKGATHVVGSFGSLSDVLNIDPATLANACDIVEIRLDLLPAQKAGQATPWGRLGDFPILFTARRKEEGSPLDLDAATRMRMLENILGEAACVDVEVASITEMGEVLKMLEPAGIPW